MDIGNIGESKLVEWCSQVDFVANKATDDKDGWDFLVAMPKKYNRDLKSLDKDNSHDQILIQVKTTKRNKGNRNIKVSNLQKLVNTPLPAFYLLIQVSEHGIPIKVHLFHVWEKIIAKVQKKLREIPKNKWDDLHKYNLTLPWDVAEEMQNHHGTEFQRVIEKKLIETKVKYSNKKNELRKSVGYTKNTGKINLEGKIPKEYEGDADSLLIDLLLGEKDKIAVEKFEIIDERFGNEIKVEERKGGYFKIGDIEPFGQANFNLRTQDFRANANLSTQLIVPKGVRPLIKDKSKLKVLFKTKFAKIFFFTETKAINYNFSAPDFKKGHQINELIEISNLFLFLNELEENEPTNVAIELNDKPFLEAKLNFPKYTGGVDVKFYQSIVNVNNLLFYLNIDNRLEVTPTNLVQQYNVLSFLNELLSPKPIYMKVEFWVEESITGYEKTICSVPFKVIIGERIFLIEVIVEGTPNKSDQVDEEKIYYSLESSNVRIGQHRMLKSEQSDTKKALKDMNEILCKKYDSEDVMVVCLNE